MKIKLIGDIHQSSTYFHTDYIPENSIQVGDLGFDYSFFAKNSFGIPKGKRFFIDGNHDFFPVLNINADAPYRVTTGLYHIPRGFVSDKTLFIGGANSIDKYLRTEGRDWWPEECLSLIQFERIMNIDQEIHTIVAHDCPLFIYPELGIKDAKSSHAYALEEIFKKFKPKQYICGHHHQNKEVNLDGCKFNILGIAAIKEFDLPIDKEFFE
jgi:hypothetical protein